MKTFLHPVPHHYLVVALLAACFGLACPPSFGALAQQAYLKAFNTGENAQFGSSIAISGDTVVVGAPYEGSNATGVNDYVHSGNDLAPYSGAVYVFVRNGTNWTQQAYLKASNREENDGFGSSVAISGDTIVVGAPSEDSDASGNQSDNSANESGAVYVFVRSGNTWTQQAFLKAANADAYDSFGRAVAVSGDTLVVGAPVESSNATGVNGNPNDNSALFSGAAYVFARNGSAWTQQAYLKASNAGAEDGFGVSVAVWNDTVVVGASGESGNGVNGESDNSLPFSGAAYVFTRTGTNWAQHAYLKASNPGQYDGFGESVAISDGTLVVGATDESSNFSGVQNTGERTAEQDNNDALRSGAAYVFVSDLSGFAWTQQAYLKASNAEGGDGFGRTVAVSGDVVAISAYFESSSATGVNPPTGQANNSFQGSGAAYVFTRTSTVWSQQAYVKASNTGAGNHPSDVGDYFGFSIGVSGDTVVAGAPREDSGSVIINGDQNNNNTAEAGAAYVFTGFRAPNGPRIAVEHPPGANLITGSTIDFGVVAMGSSRDLTFIITNKGNENLTGLGVTIDGANASDFSIIANPTPPVASGGSTFFTVRFAPGAAGLRFARLHLASNDHDENPFDIALASLPPSPRYSSAPPPQSRLDFGHVDATNTATLYIGNVGETNLLITSIGWVNNPPNASISLGTCDDAEGLSCSASLPFDIPSGSAGGTLRVFIRFDPGNMLNLDETLRVVCNDPITPVRDYRVTAISVDIEAGATFEDTIFYAFGNTAHSGKPSRTKDLGGLPPTATFTLASNEPHRVTTEIPSFLGGGSVVLSNFTGSFTVSLLPIPNDTNRVFIRVEGGTFTAPSFTLPSGLVSGPNVLTFGPPEQSSGLFYLTNGHYEVSATATITNSLIPNGVTVRGNYTGIYNVETDQVSLQSDSRDLFVASERVQLNSAPNGLWLTWANTNAVEEATNITGPWRTITNAASPYLVITTNHPQQFFRLRLSE